MSLPSSFICSQLSAIGSSPNASLETTRAPVSVGRSPPGEMPQGKLKTNSGASAEGSGAWEGPQKAANLSLD